MKQFFTLLMTVLLSAGSIEACMKKVTNLPENLPQVTILVTDTTQALLPDAQLKIGKKVLRTSWDGKLVVQPEWLAGAKQVVLCCEGYETRKMKPEQLVPEDLNKPVVLLALTPKKEASRPAGGVRIRTGKSLHGIKGEEVYMTLAASPADMRTADYMMVDEEMMPKILPAVPNNASAGMLTAGEVNDFAKWNLWSRYQQQAISYQQEWRLDLSHRYTVQLTNKRGYPMINVPVSLTDSKGNTIFQAITDNTGKAELWFGLTGEGMNGLTVNEEWKEGLNTRILNETCSASDAVDVVFIFDATGSMGDELTYLQAEMKDVIARAAAATGGLAIRTGAVVYRDHGDEYLNRISRLTDDIATTQAFIDKQEANGGGDYEEAVPEALMAALNSAGWDPNARARIAFIILDAPCHKDSATLALLHEQVRNAAALGVRLVPVVCSGLDESGEYLMRAIALATNGTSFFLTDDSGIGHTHLKPTTDSLKVEHLNDMLVRTIVEFSLVPNCEGKWENTDEQDVVASFVPNPFEATDLTEEELAAKDSRTTLYLIDISGKLIYIYEGRLEEAGDSQLSRLPIPMLSTGVYFVKAFYDGEWHTKKILVH